MAYEIAVPIPVDELLNLAQFLRAQGDTRSPVTAVRDAIDYWMDNASWKPELLHRRKADASRGYTWKYSDRCLFLPDGTQIRMPHKGKYYYAAVEGDEVKHEGRAMTPGQLANFVAQGSRNAWKCLWVKRPGDQEWRPADQLSPTAKSKDHMSKLVELDSPVTEPTGPPG
jgi:hypothetical protein